LKRVLVHKTAATHKLELRAPGARSMEMEHAREHDVSIRILFSSAAAPEIRDVLDRREPRRDAELEGDAQR
jgi:hypothetical protein